MDQVNYITSEAEALCSVELATQEELTAHSAELDYLMKLTAEKENHLEAAMAKNSQLRKHLELSKNNNTEVISVIQQIRNKIHVYGTQFEEIGRIAKLCENKQEAISDKIKSNQELCGETWGNLERCSLEKQAELEKVSAELDSRSKRNETELDDVQEQIGRCREVMIEQKKTFESYNDNKKIILDDTENLDLELKNVLKDISLINSEITGKIARKETIIAETKELEMRYRDELSTVLQAKADLANGLLNKEQQLNELKIKIQEHELNHGGLLSVEKELKADTDNFKHSIENLGQEIKVLNDEIMINKKQYEEYVGAKQEIIATLQAQLEPEKRLKDLGEKELCQLSDNKLHLETELHRRTKEIDCTKTENEKLKNAISLKRLKIKELLCSHDDIKQYDNIADVINHMHVNVNRSTQQIKFGELELQRLEETGKLETTRLETEIQTYLESCESEAIRMTTEHEAALEVLEVQIEEAESLLKDKRIANAVANSDLADVQLECDVLTRKIETLLMERNKRKVEVAEKKRPMDTESLDSCAGIPTVAEIFQKKKMMKMRKMQQAKK